MQLENKSFNLKFILNFNRKIITINFIHTYISSIFKFSTKTISNDKFRLSVLINNPKIEKNIQQNNEVNFFQFSANDLLTKNPKTISLDAKLTDAQELMTQSKINSLLVLEKNKLVGIIQIYDLGI